MALSTNSEIAASAAPTATAAFPLSQRRQILFRTEKLPSVVRRMTAGQMLLDGASVDAVAERLHPSSHP